MLPVGLSTKKLPYDYIHRCWNEEQQRAQQENRKASLWTALRKAYWLAYMPGGFFVGVIAIARLVSLFILIAVLK